VKIAVASTDETNLSAHFGRSGCFLVFTIEDGKIVAQQTRQNTAAHHASDHGQHEAHSPDPPHPHADIVEALADCQVVLCAGIGWRAAQELQTAGIRPVAVAWTGSLKALVEAFLSGTIPPQTPFCRSHQ